MTRRTGTRRKHESREERRARSICRALLDAERERSAGEKSHFSLGQIWSRVASNTSSESQTEFPRFDDDPCSPRGSGSRLSFDPLSSPYFYIITGRLWHRELPFVYSCVYSALFRTIKQLRDITWYCLKIYTEINYSNFTLFTTLIN